MKSLVSFLLFQVLSFSALAEETHLLNIKAEERAGKTYVQFELSRKADLSAVEARFLRRTIEWDLTGTQLKKDKLFQSVGTGRISNVYVSQSDSKTSRIRVNLDAGAVASDFAERVSLVNTGNTMTMIMDAGAVIAESAIREMSRTYKVMDAVDGLLPNTTLTASAIPSAIPSANTSATTNAELSSEDQSLSEVVTAESIENKSESEIPLNVKKADDKSIGNTSASRLAAGVAVIALLGLSAFLIGKKINTKRLSAPFSHDSIKVISQKYLGPKRNLTMVRVAGEYMLLGVTDHNISLIKTLSVVDDEIPELTPNDFGTAMKNLTKKSRAGKTSNVVAKSNEATLLADLGDEVEDSFSVSSLNDVKSIMKQRKYIDEIDL